MTLFVAGLPAEYDEHDLMDMFGLYGEVSSARIVKDHATGKSKCFGFVEMPDMEEAVQTIRTLHGANMKFGTQLSVKEAISPKRKGGHDDGFASRNFGGR